MLIFTEDLCRRLEEEARLAAEARACTGVLGIHPMSRDIKIDNFSVTFHGSELLQDTKLELSCGQRYGLIGEITLEIFLFVYIWIDMFREQFPRI